MATVNELRWVPSAGPEGKGSFNKCHGRSHKGLAGCESHEAEREFIVPRTLLNLCGPQQTLVAG